MYDKVKIWIDRCDVGEQISNITSCLDEPIEQTDLKTGEIKTFGSLDGLRVSVYVGGLMIKGSLPKYMYGGSNIYPLDRHTTAQAIEKIEDALHISLADAKITGFEFGANFLMRHPVYEYLDLLGRYPRLQRYAFNRDTVYYKHRGKQQPKTMVFYNKIAEAKATGMKIPQGMENANLLRAEIRFDGRLPQQLNVPMVTTSTLSDKDFYRKMMCRLQESYFAINKINKTRTGNMGKIKSIDDVIIADLGKYMLQKGNPQQLIEDRINELKTANVFGKNRAYYTRLRQRYEKACNMASSTTSDELIKELDDEFKNLGAYI